MDLIGVIQIVKRLKFGKIHLFLPGDGPHAFTLLDSMGFSDWGGLISLCKIQATGFRWECIGGIRHETGRNAKTKQNDYFLYSHKSQKHTVISTTI